MNGVITSINTLYRELEARGHKVFIFTTSNPNYKEPSPNIFKLPSMPFVFFPAYRVALFYPPKLIFNMRKFNLDIVHTQTEFSVGMFGKFVSEFLKIPMIHTYHTMYEDYLHYVFHGNLITPKVAQKFSKLFCNRAQMVIAPTYKTKKILTNYGVTKPIEVIPTGIKLDIFTNTNDTVIKTINNIRYKLNISKDSFIMLFLGRVAQEKSIDVIINQMHTIINKIPNAKLLIVGTGLYLDTLKQLVCKLKLENIIIFVGEVPWEDVNLYYKLADVFITASTSETQGLTYIEAIASGVPVVARNDDSIKDIIINHVSGYLFEDPNEIPNIIFSIKNNTLLKNKIINNALKCIDKYSDKRFALDIESTYYKLIKSYQDYKGNHLNMSKVSFKKKVTVIQNKIYDIKDKFIWHKK
jgi:1,2-diacylglycerol 3-alpha-glucosyltransferase